MRNLILLLTVILLSGCQNSKTEAESIEDTVTPPVTSHHAENLTKILNAHGGFAKWAAMKQLSYEKGGERTITNLQNRKILLESEKQTIGFDGENVWIAPDTLDASRTRFYHNLYFYFFAMPFVVGDPGAFYEDVEPREILGKAYNGIRVSYDENVGDSPDDFYIIWYDAETVRMEWLMYTVTYRSGEANENFRLIKYDLWKEVEGLSLPASIQWYAFEDDVVGEPGREVVFENIRMSAELPDDTIFVMPENAKVAPRSSAD